MDQKNPEILEVKPSETALVQRADQIKHEAWARAEEEAKLKSREVGQSLSAPMIFVENPEEREIVDSCDNLAKKYQAERGLSVVPILIPSARTQQYDSFCTTPTFHHYQKDRAPLPQMELVDLFLERVPVRRQDGALFVWSNNRYRRTNEAAMKGLIAEILRGELIHANASSTIGSVLSLLQSDRRIQEEPNLRSNEIVLENGILDFLSMRLWMTTPQRFTTFCLNEYWSENATCPTFDTFLWSISGGNRILVQRILEAIGFLLTPGNEAKRFALFQGVSNSGKSVLGNLIRSFFPVEDVAGLPLHSFGDRFSMSALSGRHLNVSMDLPSGVIEGRAAAIIKQITGDDLVFVEGKGKEGEARTIRCKLLFGSNHPVELKVRDAAFANRILLVPFYIPVPPDQMDVRLLDKLLQEKPGILYRALMAYREVVRRNYQFAGEDEFGFKLGELVVSGQPTESMGAFIEQCCILTPDGFTSSEALHQAFTIFCQGSGFPLISDRPSFSRALKSYLAGQITPIKKRVNGVPMNGYTGIELKQ